MEALGRPSRPGIFLLLGRMPDAIVDFNRVFDAARALADRRSQGLALSSRGMAEFWNHDFAAAERSLHDALAIAEEGFDDVRFRASTWLGGMFSATGRLDDGGAVLRAVEDLASKVDDPLHEAWWGLFAVTEATWAGRYDESLAINERFHDVAGQLGRALVRRGLDRVHDQVDRFPDRPADLFRGDHDRLRPHDTDDVLEREHLAVS